MKINEFLSCIIEEQNHSGFLTITNDHKKGQFSLEEMKDMKDDFNLIIELSQGNPDSKEIESRKKHLKTKGLKDSREMCCGFFRNDRELKQEK